jgi:hypothetical protein
MNRKLALPNLVAVGAIAAQGLFIEQPLDAAIQANSVGVSTKPNRPAHLLVAAATEDQRSSGFEYAFQDCSPLPTFMQPSPVQGILVTKAKYRQDIDLRMFTLRQQALAMEV